MHRESARKRQQGIKRSCGHKRALFTAPVALLLAGCLLTGLIAGFGTTAGVVGAAQTDGVTAEALLRQADPSTMDTFLEMLDLSEDTQYAGRLWTDKSVFAYGQDVTGSNAGRIFQNNSLRLTSELDGIEGDVSLNSDFLEVFSALGSGLSVSEFPVSPLDLVIVIDMSASMARDTRFGADSSSGRFLTHDPGADTVIDPDTGKPYQWDWGGNPMKERIAHSLIQKTLDAVNQTIDDLMAQNPDNRIAVVGYGAGVAVLMPLAHYQKTDTNGDGNIDAADAYLQVGGMETLYHPGDLVSVNISSPENKICDWRWINNRDACFTVVANAAYSLSSESGYTFDGVTENGGKGTDNLDFGQEGDVSGILNNTVSNNVNNRKVKALPGVSRQTDEAMQESSDRLCDVFGNSFAENTEKDDPGYLRKQLAGTQVMVADKYIGYLTNTQGGIYQGLALLAQNGATALEKTLYNGASISVPRVPGCIVMSDGGANFTLNEMQSPESFGWHESDHPELTGWFNPDSGWITDQRVSADYTDYSHRLWSENDNHRNIGDEWYRVTVFDNITSLYNDGMPEESGLLKSIPNWSAAGVLYCNNADVLGTSGTVLEVLMTASYMTAVVNGHYQNGWDAAGIAENKRLDLQTYTVNVDAGVSQWELMRLYPTLDPANCPLDTEGWWNDTEKFGENDDFGYNGVVTKQSIYKGMQTTWANWCAGNEASAQINAPLVKISLAQLPEGYSGFGVSVKKEDVIDHIVYNQGFYNVDSVQLSAVFREILSQMVTPIMSLITGVNDLGVSDSLTYMDPVGKYMEVKDVSDLVLFGNRYPIVKAGVYDYPFALAHQTDPGAESTFCTGWYCISGSGEWLGDIRYPQQLVQGLANEQCFLPADRLPDLPWEMQPDGSRWVYFLNTADARRFVSTLPEEDTLSRLKEEDPDQYLKFIHTKYTFYRVYTESGDENALRHNPAYPLSEDEMLTETTPGAYRLSDLQIWMEDVGDYNDATVGAGGLESDANFDRALWMNIPSGMIPLRTVAMTQDSAGEWTYKSNIPSAGETVLPDSAQSAAFPLRIFYRVGVEEALLNENRRIKTADIGAEYIKNNKVRDASWAEARGISEIGGLEFFSNWYNPENRYGDVVASGVEVSYGDPAASFSPSHENPYYFFERPLPLYRTAYRFDGGVWREVPEEALDGADFGGRVIGRDLTCDAGAIAEELAKTNPAVSPREGDIVLLKADRLSDVTKTGNTPDPFPSDRWYFLPVEYFALNRADGSAEAVNGCAARIGGEFGSAYRSKGVKDGDMLCWFDASGVNTQTYPYLSSTETGDTTRGKRYIGYLDIYDAQGNLKTDLSRCTPDPAFQAEGDWVVAARPGGFRVGRSASFAGEKTLTVTGADGPVGGPEWSYEDSEHGDYYKNARFPNEADDPDFQIRYTQGNITRTSSNFYLPTLTVHTASSGIRSIGALSGMLTLAAENDETGIVVNTYLGNNGRMVVPDTALAVTKILHPSPENLPPELNKAFDFQVYVAGMTGSLDAVMVKSEDGGARWLRQLNYVDVMPDYKQFLLSADGTRVTVNEQGERVVQTGTDESGAPVYGYADSPEIPYTGTVYFVFIGANTASNTYRVYQNPVNPDIPDKIDPARIADRVNGSQTAAEGRYSAKTVWLFTREQAERFRPDANGRYVDETGAPVWVGGEQPYEETRTDFELLTLSPGVGADGVSDTAVAGHYVTDSAYWTVPISFGLKDGQSVFDAGLSAEDKPYIAQVEIPHGYGLVFTGFASGTRYRVTEQISREDKAAGFAFRSVEHVVSASERNRYTAGADGASQSDPEGGNSAVFSSGADGASAYSVVGNTGAFEQAAHYVNTVTPGTLAVEKQIDADIPDTEKEFTFLLTLTVPSGAAPGDAFTPENLVTEIARGGGQTEDFPLNWTPGESGENKRFQATFVLRHGEKLTVSGIPVGAEYAVEEIGRDSYNLQSLVLGETPVPEENRLYDESGRFLGVRGELSRDSVGVSLVFHNTPAPQLPFVGGNGHKARLIGCGLLLVLAASVWFLAAYRRKTRRG